MAGITLLLPLALRSAEPPPAAQAAAITEAATIQSFADYWAQDRRDEVSPIELEVVVSYYDPHWGNFWGHDGTAVGYLPAPFGLDLKKGDRVQVRGRAVGSSGRLTTDEVTFHVLERNVPLTPVDAVGRVADFDQLKDRYVVLEAVVNRQELADANHLMIHLVSEGHEVRVFYVAENPELLALPDGAMLRLRGLYTPVHQARMDTLKIDLWINDLADIELIGTLGTNPAFEHTVAPIVALPILFSEKADRARVVGAVTAVVPGQGYKIRDTTGQVLVQTLQTLPVQIGDVLEAVGRPFTGGAQWMLRDALARLPDSRVATEMRDALSRPAPVLRLVEQVLAMSAEDAAAGRPVELNGVVMRTNSGTGKVFLYDTTGSVRVNLSELDEPLIKNGLGLRVRGVTTAGPFVPAVTALSTETWGQALLPEARAVSLEQAMTGRLEGQRIELQGHVAGAVHDAHYTRLAVTADTGDFTVVVSADRNLDGLVGCIITARGLCQAVADEHRQLTGVELWISEAEDLRVEQTALEDPFEAPLRPIASLRQFNPVSHGNFWARVRGVVLHQVPGRAVYVQDGADGLMILTAATEKLRPGEVIEATGLPALDGRRPFLREAVYRHLGRHEPPPTARNLPPGAPAESSEDSLVRATGRLLSSTPQPDSVHLLLQEGNAVFSATLATAPADRPALQSGAYLELTGVYQVVRDERRRPQAFRLLLRSADDIAVLEEPSWWTPQRALVITGALCGFIAIGVAWVLALRRRVTRQTAQIREQLAKEANLQARHRDIFENASDFIFTTDRRGRFTSFNPAGERLTGYGREEALERALTDLLVPETTPAGVLQSLQEQADGTVTFQGQLRTRAGRTVWVETSARLIQEAGEPAGVLGIVRDISERKQIEEELRRARDAAEANTRMKSSFLANMSHEIRTPMNGVIGMSNLLLETSLDAEQREFTETIRSSAESLLTVLNDILDFSKIEAGKLQFETVNFDLVDTVESTIELLAPRAATKAIEMAAFVSPDVPRHLRGDPGRLRQVLLNLLGNALKFTEQGEIVLHVTVLEQQDREASIRFEICDTGVGMPAEVQQKLFQPFSQADASTTRRFGGTGLGLAIARQLVELMHGTIGVHSTIGRGSTFWFTIPLQQATERLVLDELPDLTTLAGVRVLGVDDMAANRRIISHYLRRWGLRAEVVADAATALDRLQVAQAEGDPFRLVISDYQMPEQDGLMLAQALRADPLMPATAFILFTSLDRRLAPDEVKSLGIDGVVTKPIRVADLLNATRRALCGTPGPVSRPSLPRVPPPADAASGPRVLVAEDNVVNQRVVELQLRRLGCRVDLVANGFEVLEALERTSYDVIVMDCQMPEMDGYEATCRIRLSRFSDVHIIALTANAMEGDREQCLAAGMDDYLSKPTRPADLQAALERARKRSAPALGARPAS